MSEQTAEAAATETEATTEEQAEANPAETVEHWREIARKQEKRAKENAAAAQRLAELEDAQKSESEKAADRIAKAEAEVASVPTKVADALREHLVALHEIDEDDAELFLTATDPALLLKQVSRLVGQADKRTNRVPREGATPQPKADERAAFADFLTGRHEG
jgi:predicted phage tail protein